MSLIFLNLKDSAVTLLMIFAFVLYFAFFASFIFYSTFEGYTLTNSLASSYW